MTWIDLGRPFLALCPGYDPERGSVAREFLCNPLAEEIVVLSFSSGGFHARGSRVGLELESTNASFSLPGASVWLDAEHPLDLYARAVRHWTLAYKTEWNPIPELEGLGMLPNFELCEYVPHVPLLGKPGYVVQNGDFTKERYL